MSDARSNTNRWHARNRVFEFSERVAILGIVNVTPDSFSDGGQFADPAIAIAHGLELIQQGADVLDIGGESTRPGAKPVSVDEELSRVVPVITGLRQQTSVPISVDTSKAVVAEAAMLAGADIINDVTAGGDPGMAKVAVRFGAGVILMHMQGTPATMQNEPRYGDVVADIREFLKERMECFIAAGLPRENVALDPGFGFGKTFDHTMAMLVRLAEFRSFGRPVCLGVSRKGFIGEITGQPREKRAIGSAAIAAYCLTHEAAQIVRVHDVAETCDVVRVLAALKRAERR